MIGISRTRGGLGERVVDDASLISFGVADGKLLCVYTAANEWTVCLLVFDVLRESITGEIRLFFFCCTHISADRSQFFRVVVQCGVCVELVSVGAEYGFRCAQQSL